MTLITGKGQPTMLRVHDVGTGWGPDSDHLDVEVVFKVDTMPENAFGFQLRNDSQEDARQGMLEILRDAYTHRWPVGFDYDIAAGKKNGRAIRVWLSR